MVPDFTVDAALGGREFKFSLAEALEKGPVVLYFYPKSFTSVCTVEAHEFAENIENFAAAGASVIGLSGDKIEVQRDFSTKECRDKFPVGADPTQVQSVVVCGGCFFLCARGTPSMGEVAKIFIRRKTNDGDSSPQNARAHGGGCPSCHYRIHDSSPCQIHAKLSCLPGANALLLAGCTPRRSPPQAVLLVGPDTHSHLLLALVHARWRRQAVAHCSLR
jgi:hypothetical protein